MNISDLELKNPFINCPFRMIWAAFKKLYPDKECDVWYDPEKGSEENGYGYTDFPADGSTPQVFVREGDTFEQGDVLVHELAHVAVGLEHDHDDVWEKAYTDIRDMYDRIGQELFEREEE